MKQSVRQASFESLKRVDSSCESGARGNPMGADFPHTTELTSEPHTKNNSSRDLKDSKLTKTFAFILVVTPIQSEERRIGA